MAILFIIALNGNDKHTQKNKNKAKAKNSKSTTVELGWKMYSYSRIMYHFEINELRLYTTHRWILHWHNFE